MPPVFTDTQLTALYDALMQGIEPDLMSDRMPHLDEIYAGESAEEKKERYARYEKAFARFEQTFQSFASGWRKELTGEKQDKQKRKEEGQSGMDQKVIASLEDSFSQSA